jgi:hypothetical protein
MGGCAERQMPGKSQNIRWNDATDFVAGLARVHVGGTFQETNHGLRWWEGGTWLYINHEGKTVAVCRNDGDRLILPPLGSESDVNPP